MAAFRNALLCVVLLGAAFLAGSRPAAAQPTYASPYGYVHDIPYFAVDLVPGDVVEVGVWLEMLEHEPTTTFRYDGEFGALIVSRTVTLSPSPPGPRFNQVVESLTAEALMAECQAGSVQVNERILQQDNNGNFTILISKRESLAPCSWAGSNVTAVPPVQQMQCGDNNDDIVIGSQPRGLMWDTGAWSGNSRTVTFTAEPGFTLIGQNSFTFTDAGPCSAGPAIAPVQTYVCGPNNDRFAMPAQPPNVMLASGSGWSGNQRTFQFFAEDGYVLDGTGEFRFSDQPNRLCVSPRPSPPVTVIPPSPPRTPLPIRPTPRGFPAPRVTIVPTEPSPDQWTPSPYPPGYTPAAPPMLRTPVVPRPTPRGFPFPGFPFSRWEEPSSVAEEAAPEETSATSGAGKSLVIALAPVGVVLGAIAATTRRHID